MNKQLKQHLETVVTAIIEQDTAAGQQAFHEYLRLKSKQILMGEAAEEEGDDEDHDDKKSDDEDEDADDKEEKAEKKDDKKSKEDCEM